MLKNCSRPSLDFAHLQIENPSFLSIFLNYFVQKGFHFAFLWTNNNSTGSSSNNSSNNKIGLNLVEFIFKFVIHSVIVIGILIKGVVKSPQSITIVAIDCFAFSFSLSSSSFIYCVFVQFRLTQKILNAYSIYEQWTRMVNFW